MKPALESFYSRTEKVGDKVLYFVSNSKGVTLCHCINKDHALMICKALNTDLSLDYHYKIERELKKKINGLEGQVKKWMNVAFKLRGWKIPESEIDK